MAVTFRDRVSIERGVLAPDGSVIDHEVVADQVPATFWETLIKRVAIEGEVFESTAEAVLQPDSGVQRRDVLVVRERRWEVLTVFPGRSIQGVYKFDHATLREAV